MLIVLERVKLCMWCEMLWSWNVAAAAGGDDDDYDNVNVRSLCLYIQQISFVCVAEAAAK